MLVGATRVSQPNNISFHPTNLAGRTSVTDRQIDRRFGLSESFCYYRCSQMQCLNPPGGRSWNLSPLPSFMLSLYVLEGTVSYIQPYTKIIDITLLLGGVRNGYDVRSRDREFNSRSGRYQVMTVCGQLNYLAI